MRTTQQMSITLPNELADLVRHKVASGEYASDSEVVRDGLRVLLARDRAVETWLRDQVVLEYDRTQAGQVEGDHNESSLPLVAGPVAPRRLRIPSGFA